MTNFKVDIETIGMGTVGCRVMLGDDYYNIFFRSSITKF